MIIRSLDSEWTGRDLRHGAGAFLVTFGNEDGTTIYYEWDVDPFTRKPIIIYDDLSEIQKLIDEADLLVLQNAKGDYTALQNTVFLGRLNWDWSKVHDTLIQAHCIGSNQPKDLTTLALVRCDINIQPFERRLEEAVKEARRRVESKEFMQEHGEWFIAKKGLNGNPSLKEKTWKADYWLPRAVAKAENYAEDHPWWTVCSIYANWDSAVTLPIYLKQKAMLEKLDLWDIYLERMKLPPVGYDMEEHGLTINKTKTKLLYSKYKKGSEEAEKVCISIAKQRGHELVMPKGGRNKSLAEFIFKVMKLPVMKWTDGGDGSLDAKALDSWLAYLREDTDEYRFIKELKGKRSQDTACTYLESYQRYWLPTGIFNEKGQQLWYRLHPNLNQTGTDTLRWSSDNPNEQNISKKENFNLRSCFGPAPGREWWSNDAKNIELRLPAYEAGEREMIDLFERPDDPPYYGSYHLLVFDTLHPEKFAKYGADSKEVFESTWYQWTKNGNFACVPMETEALTADGWKTYDQLQIGDMVLGISEDQSKLEWTEVNKKFKFANAPLVKMGNSHFSVVSTPDHRWVGNKRTGGRNTRRYESRWFTTQDMTREHTILLSAPVDDKSCLNITDEEAALIGFAYADGNVVRSQLGYGPSRGRTRSKVGFRVRLFQSKSRGVEYIQGLLSRWKGRFRHFLRKDGVMNVWEISPRAARDIWRRAELWDQIQSNKRPDFERFVRHIGPSQRKAFLDAVFEAEGCWDTRGNTRVIAQNEGRLAEGIKLAMFMCGRFPTSSEKKTNYPTSNVCLDIRESKPFVTGQRIVKTQVANGDVWCVQTDLKSWVIRQNGLIMVTGNCQYGAQEWSGTADEAYHVEGAQRIIQSRFTEISKLSQRMIAFAEKHGYVETIIDKTVNPRRGYPLLCTRSEQGRIVPTVPLSYHVQGSAMWWMGKAKRRVWEFFQYLNKGGIFKKRRWPGGYYIALQVHDELVPDCPSGKGKGANPWDYNLPVIREVKRLMELGGDDFGIPTPVSCEYHETSWDTGVKVNA